jgi:hypothetical protein
VFGARTRRGAMWWPSVALRRIQARPRTGLTPPADLLVPVVERWLSAAEIGQHSTRSGPVAAYARRLVLLPDRDVRIARELWRSRRGAVGALRVMSGWPSRTWNVAISAGCGRFERPGGPRTSDRPWLRRPPGGCGAWHLSRMSRARMSMRPLRVPPQESGGHGPRNGSCVSASRLVRYREALCWWRRSGPCRCRRCEGVARVLRLVGLGDVGQDGVRSYECAARVG